MKIVVLCLSEPWYCLAATSLIRRLHNPSQPSELTWISSDESECLFRFNKKISKLVSGYMPVDGNYDTVINLTPTPEACALASDIRAEKRLGFIDSGGTVKAADGAAEELWNSLKKTRADKNIFQMMYRVCGMTWKGEGYDLSYFPRNKTRKNKTGIAIENDGLRSFIKNHLRLEMSELWHIPLKKDLLKRIDEINRCKNVVTDNLFALHASVALRKNVEFLDTDGLAMNVEFFGNGNHYRISDGSWRSQMQEVGS